MKLLRPVLISLAAFAVLLMAVIALAFTPSVQRWAVQRALAGQPGLKLEFARLAAGPTGAELRDVQFERDGLRVRASRVDADYSLVAFLFRNELNVSRVSAEGVEVDLSRLDQRKTSGSVAGAPAAAPGAIAQARLPWAVVLGEMRIVGRVLFPAATGHAALPGDFEVTGGGIAPNAEGRIDFRMRVADASPGARVSALHAIGGLRVRQTTEQTFDRAAMTLTIDAEGPQFKAPHQLVLAASMDTTADGAAYRLKVDTVQGGVAGNLLTLDATAPAREPLFRGRWSVQAQRAQVESFALGRALPEFALQGAGSFSFRTDNAAATLAGDLRGQLSGMEAIDPAWRAFGSLKWETSFDAAADPGVYRLNRWSGRLDNDRPVAAFEIKRALTFITAGKQVEIAPGTTEVGRLQLQGVPLAWVRPFVSAADISGGLITGEFLVTGDARELAVASTRPLAVAGLNVAQAGRLLLDRADVALSPTVKVQPDRVTAQVREFTLRTPAGDAIRADVEVELPLGQAPVFTVRARTEADLPRLLAAIAPIGHLRSRTAFDVTVSPVRLDVRSYEAEIGTGAGKKLLTASASRPFAIDLLKLQVIADAQTEVELGRLVFERLALADLPLGKKSPISGELADGGFVAVTKAGRLLVRPVAPLQLENLTLAQDGRRAIDGVSLQAAPTIDFGGVADWKITDGTATVRDRAGAVLVELTSEASAAADGLRGGVTFNADLAALGGQPALVSLRPLSAGRASGELRVGVAGGVFQIEARSTLNGLVAREGNQPLPIANLSLRLTRGADGRLTLDLPVLLDRLGHRSDLRVAASAAPRAGGLDFTARLTSENLELADLLALAALGGGAGKGAPSGSPTPAANVPSAQLPADVRPAWAGLHGDATVEFKNVVRGNAWSMKNVTAVARLEPASLRVSEVAGTINEKGALAGRAEVLFRGGAQPYAMQGDFTLTEFDVGALMRAFEGEKSPTLEGIFSVNGKLTGGGATLEQTLARARGQFELQSRQGVFRGLRRTSDKVSVATKAVDAVAALGSLFGSDKVKGAAEKVAGQTYQVDQLAQALAELTFDQFVIRANRDERLNFRIEEISLLSPEVRLNARGTVTHVEGKPLLEQPLALNYQLAARGKVEQMLGRLRALDGTKDELGYAKAKDLGQITGTLSRPVPNELFLRLAESRLGDFFN